MQLREALAIGRNAAIHAGKDEIKQVVVAGMGGSGIGADFVAAFTGAECKVPFLVVKEYVLPAFVGKGTVLIASSYSGNTEETLAACRQGMESGARIIAVTSGGKLAEWAQQYGWDQVLLPKGQPAPRACLGYSLVAQLSVLEKLGLIGPQVLKEVEGSADFLESLQDEFHEKAAQIAGFLQGKIPVLYSTNVLEPVIVRFRQQLAENAKMLSWHHVVPEMNHNELVGWRRDQPGLAALFFRHPGESAANELRMNITRDVVSEFAASRLDLHAKGKNLVEQTLYFVHLVDWISWYLAEMQGLDAMEIRIIDFLKEKMATAKQ